MMLMEPPVIDRMIGSPLSADLENDFRPRLDELMNLSYVGLMNRFAEDGFTDSHVRNLEAVVSSSLNEMELAEQLATALTQVEDMENQAEIEARLIRWLDDLNWQAVYNQVMAADLPDSIDALAYAACHVRNIATSTVWFETTRHSLLSQPQPEWHQDEGQIKEGIALAEAGLAQEAMEWPPY